MDCNRFILGDKHCYKLFMEFYNNKGEKINLATITDVNSKMGKNTIAMSNLPTSNTDSFLFKVEKAITYNGITIPAFSRGIFINQSGSLDGVLIAIDTAKNLYIGFRNSGNWNLRKI